MNRPITVRDALIFFVIWQALDSLKDAAGVPVAIVAAIALAAIAGIGLMWHLSE